MKKRYQSFAVLVMSLLLVMVVISCGDDESIFNSGKVKAYLRDVQISGIGNATIGFDKGVFDYTVYTTGRPATCTLTVIADNADSIVLKGSSAAITSGVAFSVNLTNKGDSEVVLEAKKAGAQDTSYKITFKPNEEDTRLEYLRSSDSSIFLTPTYRPVHKKYSMQFYATNLGLLVKPLNTSAKLFLNDVQNTTYTASYAFPTKGETNVSVTVVSADNSVTNSLILNLSRLVFTYPGPFIEYTTDPYGFTGNIKKVRDGIISAGSGTQYRYDVPETDRLITGVVTASPYYLKFVSGPGQANVGHKECFFVEDDEDGFLVAHEAEGDDLGLEIGDKVQFRVIRGVHNYGMPIAIIDPAHKAIKRLAKVSKIRYLTGDYTGAAARGRVYMWEGVPQTGIISHGEGTFTGQLMYQGDASADWAKLFVDYIQHRFYGPVAYGYNKSKIVMTHPGQIHYHDDTN